MHERERMLVWEYSLVWKNKNHMSAYFMYGCATQEANTKGDAARHHNCPQSFTEFFNHHWPAVYPGSQFAWCDFLTQDSRVEYVVLFQHCVQHLKQTNENSQPRKTWSGNVYLHSKCAVLKHRPEARVRPRISTYRKREVLRLWVHLFFVWSSVHGLLGLKHRWGSCSLQKIGGSRANNIRQEVFDVVVSCRNALYVWYLLTLNIREWN